MFHSILLYSSFYKSFISGANSLKSVHVNIIVLVAKQFKLQAQTLLQFVSLRLIDMERVLCQLLVFFFLIIIANQRQRRRHHHHHGHNHANLD